MKVSHSSEEEYVDILKDALKKYRQGNASRMLHEIAHGIFNSDNPQRMARMFYCAGDMYSLLKRIVSEEEMCIKSDIEELLRIIDGKEDE